MDSNLALSDEQWRSLLALARTKLDENKFGRCKLLEADWHRETELRGLAEAVRASNSMREVLRAQLTERWVRDIQGDFDFHVDHDVNQPIEIEVWLKW